jgi:predicted ATPase/class 3 adenylate cyclase
VRGELPSGTVTFLFTDVEGSTRLLHELGAEAYADALAEHRRVIREACAAQGGVEVDTQGDAFFFAFPTGSGALAAAEEMTEALASGPVQVRVGLHTGTPLLTEEGYVGDDVHLGARVAASGHGGQVLVSAGTAALIEPSGSEPQALSLVDLGEHRLKDIAEAVSIFQLGEGSFPPLKTISNTNLPRPASLFVGRERELRELLSRIEEGARLVTLTGPGGSGKTRLALEAAASLVPEYKAGVFWIGLATLRDAALVTETVAQTLGAKDGLPEHIGERDMLLLLDNLEQVIGAAPELSALVSACRNLNLIVTSRELLRVQGEVEYPVPPLAEPEAVSLFCERAQVEPSEEIAELCARLDNLPLAVELAAARVKALSTAQILERISQRLDLLKGGRDADPRQQTLRATIEWSYDLLSEEEQRVFARLSVFAGGCTLEAAEEVANADLDILQSLVEKSLLRFTDERFWMLETIRDYAADRLAGSGEQEQLERVHAVRHTRLAVELSSRRRSAETLQILREEQGNMRAALEFALQRDEVAIASDLVHGLWFHWLTTGSGREAAGWAHRYLASSRERLSPLERFAGDLGVAEILRFAGDAETAVRLKRELVAIGRANPEAVIHDGVVMARSTASTLSDLAYMELDAGRLEEARACGEEALALRRELGRPGGIAHALLALAAVAYYERDVVRARELYVEAIGRFEAAESPVDALEARIALAECELLLGRLDEAAALLREAIPTLHEFPVHMVDVHALRVAAMLAAARGDAERCAALFGAADCKLEESGMTPFSQFEDETQRAYLGRARTELGETVFHAGYERGAAASDETMWALALENLD